jgi:hypothetical protein
MKAASTSSSVPIASAGSVALPLAQLHDDRARLKLELDRIGTLLP